jgi:hypothetical protein
VDEECDVCAPYRHRNRYGDSVPIPNGESTNPPSRISARIVGNSLRRGEMKDRRTCEARSETKQPQRPCRRISTELGDTGPQPLFFIVRR